ncbi:histone deacetylase HosB [Aspergillus terreus]|uniref:Histone deacetylase HosB n=1 Tax=Aspergillus terreus TaxID=33178 RepID=A0A5M3ZEE4_ASPTE|nr:hypothetical protein ATETN484_0016014300 [Aspergillus terreus]GFF21572.1 histone deacetylase HosB [Aspergillus terreus]
MDPSKRDDPPAAPFPPTSSKAPHPIVPAPWSGCVSDPLAVATPPPVSSSGVSSPSLLSPLDASARPVASPAHSSPRRTTSANSLRDESRKSTPRLKKHSSTTSLRSSHNSSGGPTSPHRDLSRYPSSSLTTPPPAITTNEGTYAMSPLRAGMEGSMPTAAAIASEHFQKEVGLHQSADLQSQALVVVHDDCYGHRFSRPRASRAALNSIVERPERILATVLGISAAYVRLSHRYTGGRFAPHPDLDSRQLPVPPFQIRKTARTLALSAPAVAHVHGSKWMEDLKVMCDAAESRLALNGKELVRPPSAGKDNASAPPFHEGDLYLCSESLNAFQGALGGVCDGVDAVLGPGSTKRAFVCIRPPGHHCSSDHPSGFCWINNVHVGISYAAMNHGLTHAAIFDFDLHHGDGSQEIAWAQNQKAVTAPRNAANYKKTMIGYFSLHDINSYPCETGDSEKVRNASVCIDKAHGQSIWNVHLEPWKTDLEFWELYASRYTILLEKARAFLRLHTERLASTPNGPPPKAAIFISAGFDASEWEGAGMQRHKVNVPTDFYARFTADVVRMAEEDGLGVDGRVISVLEGGYSNRALTSGVLSHLSGLGDSSFASVKPDDQQVNRLAAEMTDRLGLYDPPTAAARPLSEPAYDPEWWSPNALDELEALVYPPPAPVKPPKSTYFAPTQSFAAKVVTPPRDRKSTGSQAGLEPEIPPISWATATHELSKILIPSNRQTTSCRPEDLNAEASRLRRERQTAAENSRRTSASTAPEENRMKLRVRKPKSSLPGTPTAETPKRQVLKSNRRTTIDSTTDLAESSPSVRSTRRKSANSTATSTPEPDASPLADVRPRASSQLTSTSNTRTATPGRKTSSSRSSTPKRSASPRKVPPVPRVPSAFLSTLSAGEGSEGSRPAASTGEKAPDVDSLTAGVRKLNIKLKVPSPEEYAARERAADERKQRSSKGPRTPRSPAKSPKKRAVSTKEEPRTLLTPDSLHATSAYPAAQIGSEVKVEDQGLPSTVAMEPSAQVPISEGPFVEAGSSTQMAISPPMTPDTAQAMAQAQSQSNLFSPPVTASHARSGLPVFTSSSAIPFASAASGHDASDGRPSTGGMALQFDKDSSKDGHE